MIHPQLLLADKIAVITGAASPRGIGKACARLFAAHGARCAILDLDAGQARQAAADIGPAHRGFACDVTDRQACLDAVAGVIAAFGRVDVLVNNAGVTQPVKIMDIRPEDYERITDVSLRGSLYMSQAVIPHLREQRSGSLIFISSISAQRGGGIFGGPHYSAAKAGMLGLAKAIARELAPLGVRANSVAPGAIRTDIMGDKRTPELEAQINAGVPLGRMGEAEEVAGACLFLASPLSSYITGATIDVNGGMQMH